jgi:hypothetical protein
MALTSFDGYLAAPKVPRRWFKTGARTTVAAQPFTLFDIAGSPGAGTLAIGNTANGVVPTDATAGYPPVPTFAATGYVGRVNWGSSVACWLTVYDRLFAAGAYAFNADTTLASQPSYSGRVPGADYSGLELWVEAVTAFTGTPSFQINYLDQAGAAGDTGVVSAGAALTVGRMFRMPLAAGDSGVQRVDRVRGSVATVGTFNVMVLRELWSGRVGTVNGGGKDSILDTGAPQLYGDSALYVVLETDSTASGLPDVTVELVDA